MGRLSVVIEVRDRQVDGDAVVEDIAYGSGDEATEAYLVAPAGAGAGPGPSAGNAGLVMWHWLDTHAPDGNRTEFLAEAKDLAATGVVSLLPQGRFPWTIAPSGATADRAQIEAETARFAAGIELIATRPDVDPQRIAVVGHDFGGMLAVLATAADPRIRSLIVMAATPRWADWFLPFWEIPEDRLAYLAAMRDLDPIEQMSRLADRPVLVQFAERDFYVAPLGAYELRAAAGEGAMVELRKYDAGHDLHHPDAAPDRAAFLGRVLEFESRLTAAGGASTMGDAT